MNITNQVIILSAELSGNSEVENSRRTNLLNDMLSDSNINFNVASGVYKGNSEVSFVTVPRNNDEVETIKDFAFKNFNQESVLYQDANQQAYLIFNNGESKRVGVLEQVNPREIETLDHYTVLNGRVYTTR